MALTITHVKVASAIDDPLADIKASDWGSAATVGPTHAIAGVLPAANLDLTGVVALTRTVNAHPLSADVVVTKADIGLSNVENTALSTWVGSANLTTLGTLPSLTMTGTATFDKGTANANAQYITFKLNETNAGDFIVGLHSVANGFGDPRRDQVFGWGYNQGPTGAPVVAGEHTMGFDIESYYAQGVGAASTELHMTYTNRAGVNYRPLHLVIDLATDVIQTAWTSDRFSVQNKAAVETLVVIPGTVTITGALSLSGTLSAGIGGSYGTSANIAATSDFRWQASTRLQAPANGQMNINNTALSAGVGFDVTTDAVLKVRTRAQTGDASISALHHLASGYYEGTEMTAPAAGAVNTGRLYFDDNGSGKTRLMVIFNTGAAQQVAIQP